LFEDSLNFPPDGELPSGARVPHVILGDSGFPLTRRLMRPYPRRSATLNQRIYNYRHSRARRTIEQAFGILAARFQIFQSAIVGELSTVDLIVKACVCLHNYLITEKAAEYCPPHFDDTVSADGRVSDGAWRLATRVGFQLKEFAAHAPNSGATPLRIRKSFENYFLSNDGKLPFQLQRVNDGMY
jgi:hypothetical protein